MHVYHHFHKAMAFYILDGYGSKCFVNPLGINLEQLQYSCWYCRLTILYIGRKVYCA